jgi:uncharacterized integral membrane protein
MKALKAPFITIIGAILLIFVIQNIDTLNQTIDLRLDLYIFDFDSGVIPIYLIIIISYLIGMIVAASYGFYQRIQLKGENRRLKRTLKEREEELNSLRNLPVLQSGETLGPIEGE